jgi:uncharacterized protein YjbJ (UPF0337 family)
MGLADKARNQAQNVSGKVKESAGKAKNDKQMEEEGKSDQNRSKAKQAGENVKDTFRG